MPQTTKSRSSITRTIPHKSTQICTQPATDSSLKSKKQPITAPSNGNTTVDVLPLLLQTKIRDRAREIDNLKSKEEVSKVLGSLGGFEAGNYPDNETVLQLV